MRSTTTALPSPPPFPSLLPASCNVLGKDFCPSWKNKWPTCSPSFCDARRVGFSSVALGSAGGWLPHPFARRPRVSWRDSLRCVVTTAKLRLCRVGGLASSASGLPVSSAGVNRSAVSPRFPGTSWWAEQFLPLALVHREFHPLLTMKISPTQPARVPQGTPRSQVLQDQLAPGSVAAAGPPWLQGLHSSASECQCLWSEATTQDPAVSSLRSTRALPTGQVS